MGQTELGNRIVLASKQQVFLKVNDSDRIIYEMCTFSSQGAEEMAQWVRVLAAQAWGYEFKS